MLEGKNIEIVLEDGLLTLEREDNLRRVVIVRFLTREEAGLRF